MVKRPKSIGTRIMKYSTTIKDAMAQTGLPRNRFYKIGKDKVVLLPARQKRRQVRRRLYATESNTGNLVRHRSTKKPPVHLRIGIRAWR